MRNCGTNGQSLSGFLAVGRSMVPVCRKDAQNTAFSAEMINKTLTFWQMAIIA
jgi:hypothetical protein